MKYKNLNTVYLSNNEIETLTKLLDNYQDTFNDYSKKVTDQPHFKRLINNITTIQIKLNSKL